MKFLTYFFAVLSFLFIRNSAATLAQLSAPPATSSSVGVAVTTAAGTSGLSPVAISNAMAGNSTMVPVAKLASFSMPQTGDLPGWIKGISNTPKSNGSNTGLFFTTANAATANATTAAQALGGFAALVKNSTGTKQDVVSMLQEFTIKAPLLASNDMKVNADASYLDGKLLEALDVQSSDYILSIAVLSFSILDPEQRVSLSWAVARAIRHSNNFYKNLFDRLGDLSRSEDAKDKARMAKLMEVLKNQDLIKIRNWVNYLSEHTIIEKDNSNETSEN